MQGFLACRTANSTIREHIPLYSGPALPLLAETLGCYTAIFRLRGLRL